MEKVRSKDGTLIAYECSGEGPPLVVISGVLTSSRFWPVLSTLNKYFTVYTVDRRGHGDSGDAKKYSIEREFEDVAAVVDTVSMDFTGNEINVLGHSFGGRCVLGAALLTSNIRRLVVYEATPPEGPGTNMMPAEVVDRLQSFVNTGDSGGVVTTFFREAFQMSPEEVEVVKTWPTYPAMIAAAPTLPRELRADERYRFAPEQFKQMDVPTLLLIGGDSPDFAKESMEKWHAVLPDSRIVSLPGQQHLAHYTAPDLLVDEFRRYLDA